MTKDEIAAGETRTLEFKEVLPLESIKWVKTVVAFANGAGGRLLIGIANDGSVVGIPDDEDIFALRDQISNTIANTCSPQVMFDIYQESLDGKVIIAVEVFPGNDTPYYVNSLGKENGTFIRFNATTRNADAVNLDELELRKKRKYYDELPFAEMDVENADIQYLCREFSLRAKTEITKQTLINMHLFQKIENNLLATKAYAIFLGRHDYLSRIQCAKFKGVDRVHFIDKKDFDGPLLDQIDGAYQFVLGHIDMALKINGIVHEEVYELPVQVIRELIVNAAVHRNYMMPSSIQVAIYDDRLEVSSPGGLYGSLTLQEALSGRSSIRNKVIASVCEKLNIIEGWGTGLKRIISICKEQGITPPIFEEIGDMLRVTIYRRNAVSGDKNGDKTAIKHKNGDKTAAIFDKILDFVSINEPAKTRDIADFVGLKPSRTKVYLSQLVQTGRIVAVGFNKSRSYISPQKISIEQNGDKTAAIDESIYRFLTSNSPATVKEIADYVGLTPTQVKNRLAKLLKKDKVIAAGFAQKRTYMLAHSKETPN